MYSRWFEMFMMREEEYFFLLENYRILRKEGAILMKKAPSSSQLGTVIQKADQMVALHSASPVKCRTQGFLDESQKTLEDLYSGFKAKSYENEEQKNYLQSLYKSLKKIVKDTTAYLQSAPKPEEDLLFMNEKFSRLGGESPTRLKEAESFMDDSPGLDRKDRDIAGPGKENKHQEIDLLNLLSPGPKGQ
jgi:hypothetical protein